MLFDLSPYIDGNIAIALYLIATTALVCALDKKDV